LFQNRNPWPLVLVRSSVIVPFLLRYTPPCASAVNEAMAVIIIRSLIIARGVPTAKTGRIGTFTAACCSLF